MESWPQKTRLRHSIELAFNGLILIACLAVISATAYNYVSARKSSVTAIPRGTKIEIPGIDWRNSRHSVVLALSTKCHFCTASADFYRRLLDVAERRSVPVVFVFPQPKDEIASYLRNLDIPFSLLKQMPLENLHVTVTPTVFIVNSDGEITDSWTGQLPAKLEQEVTAKL